MADSGKLAESGEGLRQRFKKAVVAGGRHKGARYNDLSEPEIRRCANSYRGDMRFSQYCKQRVALNVLAPESTDGSEAKKQEPTANLDTPRTWKDWGLSLGAKVWKILRSFAKGRKLFSFLLVTGLCWMISRPAFGKLCSRLSMLVIRGIIRRSIEFITMVLDSILDEAVFQVETALWGPPPPTDQYISHTIPAATAQQPVEPMHMQIYNAYSDLLHWVVHIGCIVLGILSGRMPFLAVQPHIHNP